MNAWITSYVPNRLTAVVDQDVERTDCLDGRLDLRRIGHVERHGDDAPVGVGQLLPGTGIDPGRAFVQGLVDQRLPDPPICSRHQHCLAFDLHVLLLGSEVLGDLESPSCKA